MKRVILLLLAAFLGLLIAVIVLFRRTSVTATLNTAYVTPFNEADVSIGAPNNIVFQQRQKNLSLGQEFGRFNSQGLLGLNTTAPTGTLHLKRSKEAPALVLEYDTNNLSSLSVDENGALILDSIGQKWFIDDIALPTRQFRFLALQDQALNRQADATFSSLSLGSFYLEDSSLKTVAGLLTIEGTDLKSSVWPFLSTLNQYLSTSSQVVFQKVSLGGNVLLETTVNGLNIVTPLITQNGLPLNSSPLTSTDDLKEGTTNLYLSDTHFNTKFGAKSTDDLPEGLTNKYYGSVLFDDDLALKTTDDLTEGSFNKYYSDDQVADLITDGTNGITWVYDNLLHTLKPVLSLSSMSTSNLAQGTNLYFTSGNFDTELKTKTTDDLKEGTTNLYLSTTNFNTKFGLKTTDNLTQGSTNLYYTDALARAALSTTGLLSYNNGTGVLGLSTADVRAQFTAGTNITLSSGQISVVASPSITGLTITGLTGVLKATAGVVSGSANSDDVPQGSTNLYLSDSTFNTKFNLKTTDDLKEGTAKYFANSLARAALSATGILSYSNVTGVIDLTASTVRSQFAAGDSNLTYDNSTGTFTLAASPSVTSLTVNGDLNVLGQLNAVSATQLNVQDLFLHIANGNASNALDFGLYGEYKDGTVYYSGLLRSAANTRWYLFDAVTTLPTTGLVPSGATLGKLTVSELAGTLTTASQPNITALGTLSALTLGSGTGVLKAASGVVTTNATTDDLTEGTAKFFSNTLARAAISVSGAGLSYSLGVLSNTGVTDLTGTSNQVIVSGSTGSVTLSLPQNIHTAASPTFSGLTLSSLTGGGVITAVYNTGACSVATPTTAGFVLQSAGATSAPVFQSAGLTTFESIINNIGAYNQTITYSGQNVSTITFTTPGGSIVATFNYTGILLTTIVLSGAGLPSYVSTTKTMTYNGSNQVTGVAYT